MDKLDRAKEVANLFLRLPLGKTKFSPVVVTHPFLESAIIYDNMSEPPFNAFEEQVRFEEYLISFYDNYIDRCEDIPQLVSLVRKPYMLGYIKWLKNYKIIDIREAGNLLAEHWTDIERLCGDANVDKRQVLRWIRRADKSILMEQEDLDAYNSFKDEVTVYRGYRYSRHKLGLSWTIDSDKAVWFANRYKIDKKSYVAKAKIKKEDIVAYISSGGESEVIVDFTKLYNIEVREI